MSLRHPSLGYFVDDRSQVSIDLPRLLETRLLIQANSGQGKSRALRRLLEQTAGQVQQIILDPEGEFASLREKHDLIICAAQGGDVVLHPRTAALLARRLRETKVSAVLDFSELHAHQRKHVARLFLEALVECPRSLWDPALVVIDECQIFAPEKGHGESEALEAVADLTTRGRKRGLCLVAATLRISTLNKDVAAELKNRLIGGTVQDLDIKRLAFDLGMTPKDTLQVLRNLEPGHFLAYGPALHQKEPRELVTGDVFTTHPEVGKRRLTAPPKPTPAIVALLPRLADLPKEAEEQARSMEDLKRELSTARRELAQAKKSAPATPAPSKEVLQAAESRGFERGLTEGKRAQVAQLKSIKSALHQAIESVISGAPASGVIAPARVVLTAAKTDPPPRPITTKATARKNGNGSALLSAPQQKLLDTLAWLESHDLYPAPKETLAAVAGVSPTSGGYFNNLGALRNQLGLIDYPTPGEVAFTEQGRAHANPTDDSRPVHEHWFDVVTPPQRAILEALVARHPEAIGKDQLAGEINVSPTSGGYFNNLGRLRTLGAIDYPQKGFVALTRHVMP